MKVLVTGATGFIGTRLLERLKARGHATATVSRTPGRGDHDWSRPSLQRGVDWADGVIHLAGENLFAKRWTKTQKEVLRASRLETTRALAEAVARRRSAALVSTSAVGFYPPSDVEVFDETAPPGTGFLADLCRKWEGACEPARVAGVRTAVLRNGVVLGKDGGALAQMLTPFKMFVGGPLGSGRQWVPWVHLDDCCDLYAAVLEHPEGAGIFNNVAPEPVTMKELASTLGKVLGRPSALAVPGFVLKIALGEVADVLLTGQRVAPARAARVGFVHRHSRLEGALRAILGTAFA